MSCGDFHSYYYDHPMTLLSPSALYCKVEVICLQHFELWVEKRGRFGILTLPAEMRLSLPSTAHLLPLWVFITASGSVTPSTNQDRYQQLISSTNSHVQQTSQDLSSIIDASPLLS